MTKSSATPVAEFGATPAIESGAMSVIKSAAGGPASWSVYLHFPFCRHRCAYCDFATVAATTIPRRTYTDAVLAELEMRTAELPKAPIKTVFFGGGTPSLWGAAHIAELLQWLDNWAGLQRGAEITLEANPGASGTAELTALAEVGVNRLSVGVQALDDRRLKALDRVHDAGGALATLRHMASMLDSGKLQSASADLILGGPGQDLRDLREDVDTMLSFGLPHLSVYALTVEDGTPLHEQVARGFAAAPDDGLQAEMLEALPGWLADAGLLRYEVSSFARSGHESRHNMAYWIGAPYLAVGVGAHGFLPQPGALGRRYGNHRNLRDWRAAVLGAELPEALSETIEPTMHADERLLTGMRLRGGVDVQTWRPWAPPGLVDRLLHAASDLQRQGAPLLVEGTRLQVLSHGFIALDNLVLQLSEAMHAPPQPAGAATL